MEPQSANEVPEARAHRTRCDNCGAADMAWDAEAAGLKCPSCAHVVRVPEAEGEEIAAEQDLLSTLRERPATWDLGAQARQSKCNECGAVIEFPDGVVAKKCSYCDSPSVLEQAARSDLIQPGSLVPFRVGKDPAVAAFRGWLGKLWFRPSDLKHKAEVAELRGVYVPYWTFDTDVHSRWTAQAGYHYYVTERQSDGTTRRVRKTRWVPAAGSRDDHYDDFLVCASAGLPDRLVGKMENYDTSELVVYQPQYLQGYLAESYAVDLAQGWDRAQKAIAAIQRSRCASDVPGDTHRFLSARHRFSSTTFKHVLLPVWIAAFRYQHKVYQVLINGQTGKVSGKAPLSWAKIVLLVAAMAALVVAGVLFWQSRR